MVEENLDVFANLVKIHSRIASHIQELCLFTRTPTRSASRDADAFVGMLKMLPLLHTLRFWGFHPATHTERDGPAVCFDIPRLRHLELGAIQTTTEDFLELLALFSRAEIGTLSLKSCVVLHTLDDARDCELPATFKVPWKVGALQIALGLHDFLLDLLSRILRPGALHTLECGGDVVGKAARPKLTEFAEKFPHLRHVRWDVCGLFLLDAQSECSIIFICDLYPRTFIYMIIQLISHPYVTAPPYAPSTSTSARTCITIRWRPILSPFSLASLPPYTSLSSASSPTTPGGTFSTSGSTI